MDVQYGRLLPPYKQI